MPMTAMAKPAEQPNRKKNASRSMPVILARVDQPRHPSHHAVPVHRPPVVAAQRATDAHPPGPLQGGAPAQPTLAVPQCVGFPGRDVRHTHHVDVGLLGRKTGINPHHFLPVSQCWARVSRSSSCRSTLAVTRSTCCCRAVSRMLTRRSRLSIFTLSTSASERRNISVLISLTDSATLSNLPSRRPAEKLTHHVLATNAATRPMGTTRVAIDLARGAGSLSLSASRSSRGLGALAIGGLWQARPARIGAIAPEKSALKRALKR